MIQTASQELYEVDAARVHLIRVSCRLEYGKYLPLGQVWIQLMDKSLELLELKHSFTFSVNLVENASEVELGFLIKHDCGFKCDVQAFANFQLKFIMLSVEAAHAFEPNEPLVLNHIDTFWEVFLHELFESKELECYLRIPRVYHLEKHLLEFIIQCQSVFISCLASFLKDLSELLNVYCLGDLIKFPKNV